MSVLRRAPHTIPPHGTKAVCCQAFLARISTVIAALLIGISAPSRLPDSSACDLNSLTSQGMNSISPISPASSLLHSNKTRQCEQEDNYYFALLVLRGRIRGVFWGLGRILVWSSESMFLTLVLVAGQVLTALQSELEKCCTAR